MKKTNPFLHGTHRLAVIHAYLYLSEYWPCLYKEGIRKEGWSGQRTYFVQNTCVLGIFIKWHRTYIAKVKVISEDPEGIKV